MSRSTMLDTLPDSPDIVNAPLGWHDPRIEATATEIASRRRAFIGAAKRAATALLREGFGERVTRATLLDIDGGSSLRRGDSTLGSIIADARKALESQGGPTW